MLACVAAILFYTCLVSVQVSAPYVIAGSTQELYTCLFRQMAMLILKISWCLAYSAKPAMIIRYISFPCFFLEAAVLSQLYLVFNILYQHTVEYNHHLCLSKFIFRPIDLLSSDRYCMICCTSCGACAYAYVINKADIVEKVSVYLPTLVLPVETSKYADPVNWM